MERKVEEAANRIEELSAELKQAAIDIRNNGRRSYAYQYTYNLRTELGRVVATLGSGKPPARSS